MKIQQAPQTYSKVINDQVVILEKDKEHVKQLNEIASILWQEVTEERSLDYLVTRVSQDYNVEKAKAKEDILDWVQQLEQENLLVVTEK